MDDKIEIQVEAIVPYSRDYFLSNYGPFNVEIIKMVEEELIPTYLMRLAEIKVIRKLHVFSNELKNDLVGAGSKIDFIKRDDQSLMIADRASLLQSFSNIKSKRMILLNPLFPLISQKTICSMIEAMFEKKTNVFLGCEGKISRTTDDDNNTVIWDYGAVTCYYDYLSPKLKNQVSLSFSDYASLEILNFRKIKDIELIKVLQNMGMYL
ncbi:hypothetical protein N9D09_01215 [bacterium]|nr:hypothetical protein [bacterium]